MMIYAACWQKKINRENSSNWGDKLRTQKRSQINIAVDALNIMKQHNISQLPITPKGKYVGMVHLHDLEKEGIL